MDYGVSSWSGSISRPLYVPQVGQMRCGRFGEPHCGHAFTRGASSLCVARRLSRRAFDVFLFGTAMSGGQSSRRGPSLVTRRYDRGEPPGSPYARPLAGYPASRPFPEGGPPVPGLLAAHEITKSYGAVTVLERV